MFDIGKDLQTAYDIGYEHGLKKSFEWISVKDRLPEYNKDVLVYTKMGYMDVDFNKSSFSANFYRNNRDVTHWMPLPEPPKGE